MIEIDVQTDNIGVSKKKKNERDANAVNNEVCV